MERKDSKINILFIIMQMGMGGSERLIHNVVLKLDRRIFNPSIAWFFGDKILKEFQDLNVPLYHVPKVKRIDFTTMEKLRRVIRENNIHIVNAHHFMSMVYAFYGCKIRNHAKLIYTEHSEWEIEKIPWKWKKIGGYLLNRADAVVGVNSAVSKQIKNKFKTDEAKNITIQNGVDLESFNNCHDKTSLKNKLGIANDEKVIGIVANLKKVKNHIFLLQAFNKLIHDFNKVKLLLIGQGFEGDAENTEKTLKKYVIEKNISERVLFLGYRSDIAELLNIIDIFCLTSLKEGLPISLIEAMAAGLPVIGTDVDGIRDVIIPQKNGFVISIDDVSGLKDALLMLLKNKPLCQMMGEESKSLAANAYSLDRCSAQYQELFMSMMKCKRDD